MKSKIVKLVVGTLPSYKTGAERIVTLKDAIKWRLGSLPGLDALVNDDGSVRIFWTGAFLVPVLPSKPCLKDRW
jgi:hypothetical protein